jgi:hypothetical protein
VAGRPLACSAPPDGVWLFLSRADPLLGALATLRGLHRSMKSLDRNRRAAARPRKAKTSPIPPACNPLANTPVCDPLADGKGTPTSDAKLLVN